VQLFIEEECREMPLQQQERKRYQHRTHCSLRSKKAQITSSPASFRITHNSGCPTAVMQQPSSFLLGEGFSEALALRGNDQDYPGTGRDAETLDKSIGLLNKLRAKVRDLEEERDTLLNTLEEERKEIEHERSGWITGSKQRQSELLNLKRQLDEMEKSQDDKVASLKAQHTQDIIHLNTEHNKTIGEMQR
jgi:hypothetical protein